MAKGNGFGQALHQTSHADLIDHLGQLSGTTGAHMGKSTRKSLGHGRSLLKGLGIAAAHDGQLAVHGTGLSTRDRCIQEVQTQFLGLGIQFACDLGRGCGVVDKNRASLHAGKSALLTQGD